MNFKAYGMLLLLLVLLLPFLGCRPPVAPPPVEAQWPVMSTVVAVSLPQARSEALPRTREVVRAACSEVEQTLSAFRQDGDLERLNGATNGVCVALGGHATACLAYALRVAEESDGAFDPTVGPWMEIWGFRSPAPRYAVPTSGAMADGFSRTGWTNVWLELDHPERDVRDGSARARLLRPGVRLDLGAIAKGYAVDLAYTRLRADGSDAFLVNLAGNMRGMGNAAPNRVGWRVGVRNPFDGNSWLGVLTLTNGEALATSGNYERFVTLAGRRYAHIIDPRCGRPVEGLAGVTVLASSAMEADALSTALFVLGPSAGRRLLSRHPGCQALYVPDVRPARVLLTPGLAARFVSEPGVVVTTLAGRNDAGDGQSGE